MQTRSPFDELLKEHAGLISAAGALETSIRGLTKPDTAALSGGAVVRDELDLLQRAMKLHFRREEEAVFPEAQRMVSEGATGADVFGRFFAQEAEDDMSAHAILTGRASEMIQIAQQIEGSSGLDGQAVLRLLALANLTMSLLQRHAQKEDTLIFPMIERSLTPDQVDIVSQRLQKLDSDRDLLTSDDGGLSRM